MRVGQLPLGCLPGGRAALVLTLPWARMINVPAELWCACMPRKRIVAFCPKLGGHGQGCTRREGTSQAAPEAVEQAVGGGCQSGWGRLLSVILAVEASTCRQGDSGWA